MSHILQARFARTRGGVGLCQTIARTMMAGALALLCSLVAPRRAAAQETAVRPMTLHVGFTRSSFRNVNASDATAAFRVFAQTAARKRGFSLETDARLFGSAEDCQAEIRKGNVNMVILDTWDYLEMDIQSTMEPLFAPLEDGTTFREHLVLTRRGSGLTTLADLRGKNIMVLEGMGGNLSLAWLDSLLFAQHLESNENFFGKLEPVPRPAGAVLPVFFGTKAACLVDRAAFQVMSELNPQVGSNLVVTAASEPYLENILCLSRSGWLPQDRLDLIKTIGELHLEPSGRQILELFKLERIVPFKDEYLNTARKLRAGSRKLVAAQTNIRPDPESRRER
jgi:phosphonate transport system substrate-binding protein